MENLTVITEEMVQKLLPKRTPESDKWTYGKVLNVAGSLRYQGAAYLSSISALKVGAGYVSLACPYSILDNIACKTSDLTFLPLADLKYEIAVDDASWQVLNNIEKYKVLSIGSGLGLNEHVARFVENILKNTDMNTVIDADALNAVAQNGIFPLKKNIVMTPHIVELSRLLGVQPAEIEADRLKYLKLAHEKYRSTIVFKGHQTLICSAEGEIFVNKAETSSLAKAGTGDVLTGMIAGFMAQGSEPLAAAILGVFFHAKAGDMIAKESSEYSLLASELLEYIPRAISFK